MNRVTPWLLAFRPKTLPAAVAPVLVGTGLAVFREASARWDVVVCALAAALAIQVATNLFNDAIDHVKGADTAERTDPIRVTQSGLLAPSRVLFGGAAACGVALAFGIPLVVAGGWPIVIIGLTSLVLAYAYTGGPWPLAYLGLGDAFVILFFGLIAVGGTYYLHAGAWHTDAAVAGLQIGLLAAAILAINNLRDVSGDRAAGKRTPAVRFGTRFARAEITLACLVPFVLNLWWWRAGAPAAALLPLVALPLAVIVVAGVMRTSPGPRYNAFLAGAAGLEIAFAGLLTVGFVL